jgi:hypothetical protein
MDKPQVTIKDVASKPSDVIIADVNRVVEITDAKGRAIKLRKPGVLTQYRIVEALGEASKNSMYMAMVMPLLFVMSIDGEAVVMPRTKLEVEGLIQRLDHEGVDAVMAAVAENYMPRDLDADKAAIKN